MLHLRKYSCRFALVCAVLCLFPHASVWAQDANLWKSVDLGSAKVPGKGSVTGEGAGATYIIFGQGYIFDRSDSGHFYYQSMGQNGTMVAHLVKQDGTAPSCRMGVMIRTTLDGRDPNIFVGMSNCGAFCQVRTVQGDKTTATAAPGAFPEWVKVVRQGNQVSGFISSDGQIWNQVGPTTTVDWPQNVLVGLAVGSNSPELSKAIFDNVTLTSDATAAASATP